MTKLELFTNRIELIRGVESFILVRRSGEVVTHNMKNPEEVASMVTICGIGASAIMQTIGFSQFRHLMFNRIEKRNFMIFFLDRYFLGVEQITGTDEQRLAAEINKFLEELLLQHHQETN